MKKPPATLVDRPAWRDWAIWLAGGAATRNLWDVGDIYVRRGEIWGTLGLRGAFTTLIVELVGTIMVATFLGLLLTVVRRRLRIWRYRSWLRRTVEVWTGREMQVFYQPTVGLRTGNITGVEALVRWQHPSRGLLPPEEFIALAEDTGLIVPIGRWVLQEASTQVKRWQEQFQQPLTVSVNVSGRQLEREEFVDEVADSLEASGLPPDQLVLEITESVLLKDMERTVTKLRRLKQLGVQLAIDDFGTGYSSLSYLHRLPVDLIKIDKSFVHRADETAQQSALLDAIVQLGRALGLLSVAEGIEHRHQVDRLRLLQCDYGQGYLFSQPLPAGSLHDLLSETVAKPDQGARLGLDAAGSASAASEQARREPPAGRLSAPSPAQSPAAT